MTAMLTSDLGRFLENIRYEQLPASTLPLVRNAFTDTVGVIMVGITEPVVDIVRRTLVETGGRREARMCLSPITVSAPDAALVGGTAGHALDLRRPFPHRAPEHGAGAGHTGRGRKAGFERPRSRHGLRRGIRGLGRADPARHQSPQEGLAPDRGVRRGRRGRGGGSAASSSCGACSARRSRLRPATPAVSRRTLEP